MREKLQRQPNRHEIPSSMHCLETIRRDGLTVRFFDTLPLNGDHFGTIISDPGLAAHPEAKDISETRYHLNRLGFGTVDWFEEAWGNRLAPLGQDGSRENERALKCHDIILSEINERVRTRGVTPDIHSMGWSRGAAIATVAAGQNPSRITDLILVCPGFMQDTSWAATKRYLQGRAADALKGIRRHGARHLRDFAPFLKAAFANPHRMIHRGGATAGYAPLDEMFAAAIAGVKQKVIQGDHDETFPPDVVRNTIEKGFIERYDTLLGNAGKTVFAVELEELMPEFVPVPGGHGIGTPEIAAEIIATEIRRMNTRHRVS